MIRLRRLRENEVLRNMVRETQISKSDLVYPVFIKEGTNEKNPVDSRPGIYQYTLDRFDEELERIQAAGIPAILIFGIPEHKDECGSGAYDENGITQRAVREIKKKAPELLIIADVCLCEYTSHGHCGLVQDGKILNESGYLTDTISGEVSIALPQNNENLLFKGPDAIVIVGEQPEMARRAVEQQVSCLIVCQAELPEDLRQQQTNTCIIATPFDAYKAARMVYYAIEVARVCRTEDLEAFHLTDFVDDVREVVLKSRHRSYPILDENDKVVGTLSRYHLIKPRRKRVVLVDHNEAAQSVPGLEQAEIVEIIDHHRLADIQTTQPIRVRNEPVGSTTTIITNMYQEHGVMPSPNMAGLMAGAILSDTVMFKSPTCTKRDIAMAERMARIANVSLKELGNLIFAASSAGDKSAEDLCFADFKEFHIADHYLGVGQVTSLDSAKVLERKDELLAVMATKLEQQHYDMIALMVTDVLLEGTNLLYIGNDDTIRTAFSVEPKDSAVFLPGVMSRKKQIIPMLSILWG